MDFNNDGLLDLIVGEREGYVNYFRREAAGTLTSEGRLQSSGTDIDVGTNSAPFLFDWDADGDLDLLVGRESTAGGSLWLYMNQGTPENHSFSGYSTVNIGASPIAWPRSVPHMDDLSGDGLFDLIIGEDNGHTYYCENTGTTGNPQFDAAEQMTVNGSPYVWPSGQTDVTVYTNDWNEDGITDIVQGNYTEFIWVFLGQSTGFEEPGPGSFQGQTVLSLAMNPVSSTLEYSVTLESPATSIARIFSVDGRIVAEQEPGPVSGSFSGTVDVSGLPAGVYTLSVSCDAGGDSRLLSRQFTVVR